MSEQPDQYSQYGYTILQTLTRGHDRSQVRYVATDIYTNAKVFIDAFQANGSAVADSAQIKQQRDRLQALAQLDHPGVLPILDDFETPDRVCLVQAYKETTSLADLDTVPLNALKHIAAEALKILVYCQQQSPFIIHQNICPETILVDRQQRIYLTGFAISPSHGAADDLYMAPEQRGNRRLRNGTDLYGLGMTLLGLLLQRRSPDLAKLLQPDGRVNFQAGVPPQVSLQFIDWLSTMIHPAYTSRFLNAEMALAALEPIPMQRFPEVVLSPTELSLRSQQFGDMLQATVAISNPVPDTLLQGHWSLTPPSDSSNPSPPGSSSSGWLRFKPNKFQGNRVGCQITVDTSKLLANQTYTRQIWLHANSAEKLHPLTLTIETAALKLYPPPLQSVAIILTVALLTVWLGADMTAALAPYNTGALGLPLAWVGYALGLALGSPSGILAGINRIELLQVILRVIGGCSTGIFLMGLLLGSMPLVAGYLLAVCTSFCIGLVASSAVKHHLAPKFGLNRAIGFAALAVGLGGSLGFGSCLGWQTWSIQLALAATGLPLLGLLGTHLHHNQTRLSSYQRQKPSLLKP